MKGQKSIGVEKWCWVQTVLAATSVDCAETSASNDTVRRMHDDNVELSNKCGLPKPIEFMDKCVSKAMNILSQCGGGRGAGQYDGELYLNG